MPAPRGSAGSTWSLILTGIVQPLLFLLVLGYGMSGLQRPEPRWATLVPAADHSRASAGLGMSIHIG